MKPQYILCTREESKTIGRGARVKKIERPDQRKLYFLLHKLYFSVNRGMSRRGLTTTLVPPLPVHILIKQNQKIKSRNFLEV
jgi:hypothetical protein